MTLLRERDHSATRIGCNIRQMTDLALVRIPMILATLGWAAGEALMRRSAAADRLARAIWTIGIALALVHVVLAFQVVYAWDHEAAVVATAQQAADRFGWGWRGSIYVNYVFVALWLADVGWWWLAPRSHASRSATLEASRLVIFGFMFLNGAVIFASGVGRVVGVVSLAVVLAASLGRRSRMVSA
jgi:hypothetical protein